MKNTELLSDEKLDFLREVMNIGAGNAATALTQLLQSEVKMEIPRVHAIRIPHVPSILGDPSSPVAGVRMKMVGDVVGDLFFIVSDEHRMALMHLLMQAMPRPTELGSDSDLSPLMEMGNILAGVFLRAIHDFCKLTIHHSVPKAKIDMIHSLLDESLAVLGGEIEEALLVENEFITDGGRLRTFLLVIPSGRSVQVLGDSIEQARMGYGSA